MLSVNKSVCLVPGIGGDCLEEGSSKHGSFTQLPLMMTLL